MLKLRNYAFQGVKWEVKERFWSLHTLVLEDTDLVEWKVGSESLKSLKSLSLKHCYRLVNIQWENVTVPDRIHWACKESLKKIEIVDCNPLGAEEMNKALPSWKKDALDVHSSWDEMTLSNGTRYFELIQSVWRPFEVICCCRVKVFPIIFIKLKPINFS